MRKFVTSTAPFYLFLKQLKLKTSNILLYTVKLSNNQRTADLKYIQCLLEGTLANNIHVQHETIENLLK